MYQSNLISIKNFLLEYNTYFNKGFDDVYQDETTGIIHAGKTKVFPMDSKGDYFYLRLPNKVNFTYDSRYTISDCQKGLGMRTEIVLVAFVKDADSSKLMDNLVTSIRNYSENEIEINIKNAIFNAHDVINQELAKVSPEIRKEAHKNLKDNYALVSIGFEVTKLLLPKKLSCIENPCKTC